MTATLHEIVPNEFGALIEFSNPDGLNIDPLSPEHLNLAAHMMARMAIPISRIASKRPVSRDEFTWRRQPAEQGGYIELLYHTMFGSDRKWTTEDIYAADEVRTPEELAHWENLGRYPLEQDPFWSEEQLASLGERQVQRATEDQALADVIAADIIAKFRETFPEISLEAA